MKTSFWIRVKPGRGLPSSAIRPMPGVAVVPVKEPTIEGTCMRKPAFTMRTKTLPVTPEAGAAANRELPDFVRSKATPLMR